MDIKRPGESNIDWFNRYVMNNIPIRLIRLSDMTFAGRSDVKEHFQGQVSMVFNDPSRLVKYAILSHRWMEGKEITYEMMKSGRQLTRSPGYKKLRKFCEKAGAYGVEFAWSDTCCIDKNSSTEIDESIRSMFRWYRNSYICIIHLAQSDTIQSMTGDEWMKRGWTLQELLAPRRIKLFNKQWMPMTGDRNDKSPEDTEVMVALGNATGIHPEYLREFDPGPFKVDERMTWAAERKTTRVEDVAYSLMGIFNVSMQIAYGEGGDRAFCRLIEAIMQAGDPSVLNWVGDAASHHCSSAIPRSPEGFVGRRLELPQRLEWRLEMTMTNLGLRVPLVILPLNIKSDPWKPTTGYEWHYEATLALCPAVSIHFSDVVVPHRTRQFALGIVNHLIGSCKLPRIPGQSIGFILYRGPEPCVTVCKPRSEDFNGLQTISPPNPEFDPWKKARNTGLVRVDFPHIPSDYFFYVGRKHLEFVYL